VVKPPRRFDIVLVKLDPTIGSEIRKIRPCLVVSPDEMNEHLQTLIVAPMTTTVKGYPTRVAIRFQRRDGQVALDQLRAIDRARVVRRLGKAAPATAQSVAERLVEMFVMAPD
jgi:mRNA interferase MazF